MKLDEYHALQEHSMLKGVELIEGPRVMGDYELAQRLLVFEDGIDVGAHLLR